MSKKIALFFLLLFSCIFLLMVSAQGAEPADLLPCAFHPYPPIERVFVHLKAGEGRIRLYTNPHPINALAVDGEDLWVGTAGGLLRSRGGIWTIYTTAEGLSFNNISSILATEDRIWIGACPTTLGRADLGGLTCLSKKDGRFRAYGPRSGLVSNWISSVLQRKNLIVFGTRDGLGFFDLDLERFVYGKKGIDVADLYLEGENLWVNVLTQGPEPRIVLRYGFSSLIYTPLEVLDAFQLDEIFSMAPKDGYLWACGLRHRADGGRSVYLVQMPQPLSPASRFFRLPARCAGSRARFAEIGGKLFLLTDRGFGILDGERLDFYCASEEEVRYVPYLACDPGSQEIWMAFPEGVGRLSYGKIIIYIASDRPASNFISSMARKQDGVVWLAAQDCLDRFSCRDRTFTHFGPPEKLGTGLIREVFFDPHGDLYAIWIDSAGKKHPYILQDEKSWKPGSDVPPYSRIGVAGRPPMLYSFVPEDLHLELKEQECRFLQDKSTVWIGTPGGGLVEIRK